MVIPLVLVPVIGVVAIAIAVMVKYQLYVQAAIVCTWLVILISTGVGIVRFGRKAYKFDQASALLLAAGLLGATVMTHLTGKYLSARSGRKGDQ